MPGQTTNFKWILPLATDLWNALTEENPAIEAIDAQAFKNMNAGVQPATHTKLGTVHALVREVKGAPVIRFVATENFIALDTFTVDGEAVSARLVDGTALQSGCFKTGNNVLAIFGSGVLTVFAVSNTAEKAKQLATPVNIGKAPFDGSTPITLEDMGLYVAEEYKTVSFANNVHGIGFAITQGKTTGLRYRCGFEIRQAYAAGTLLKLCNLDRTPTTPLIMPGMIGQSGMSQVPCIISSSGAELYLCSSTSFSYTSGVTYPLGAYISNS